MTSFINLAELARKLTEAKKRSNIPDTNSVFSNELKTLNLEQLRKQARELLNGWQAGDEAAMKRLSAHPNRAKLARQTPQLSDAQLVIARELNFSQWARLKQYLEYETLTREAEKRGKQVPPDHGEHTFHFAQTITKDRLALSGFRGDFVVTNVPFGFVPLSCADNYDGFVEDYIKHQTEYVKQMVATGPRSYREKMKKFPEDTRNIFDALKKIRDYDRVCLWYGPNQSEALSFAFMMNFFTNPELRPRKLELVQCISYPGIERLTRLNDLPPLVLPELWQNRRTVDDDLVALGKKIWWAFVEPSPLSLYELVRSELAPLPDMKAPLLRHLQTLPALSNGLGLPEQLTLQRLANQGPRKSNKLFDRVSTHDQPLPGSLYFAWGQVKIDLMAGDFPAIKFTDDRPFDREEKVDRSLSITDTGRKLLAGELHWMDLGSDVRKIHNIIIDPQKAHWCWDWDNEQPVLRQPGG